MINGILLVDKEEGITSYDVIRKLKKVLPEKQKIGHGGTLDPFATGLLVVLLGKGTKLMNTIHQMRKVYDVTMEFGYETDTQDPTGQIVEKDRDLGDISKSDIEEALGSFRGRIEQMPPKYSAKKVKGKKAYDLARAGKEFELKAKEVEIFRFDIVDFNFPKVSFSIECSTGTYVRTLVVDLARKLGTYGTAIELRRVGIGDFNVGDGVKSSDIGNDVWENVIEINNLNV